MDTIKQLIIDGGTAVAYAASGWGRGSAISARPYIQLLALLRIAWRLYRQCHVPSLLSSRAFHNRVHEGDDKRSRDHVTPG